MVSATLIASVRSAILNAVLDAAAILAPVDCAGCGSVDRSLCAVCRRSLEPQVTVHPVGGIPVYCAVRYAGAPRRVILGFKELGRTDVAAALAASFAPAIVRAAAVAEGPVELALVPTSRVAWRRRGYDPVKTLVRAAGGRSATVLLTTRRAGVQKSLGVAERSSNRHGAFVARGSLAGRRFVVIDDVLTSGATMTEAIRAISAAGGEVISGACLAFTMRLSAMSDNR